eukprot:Blabericola_migrator_1__10091@NODE_55_length_16001_cov_154_094327_g51_i0_p8_GENE_NODE_55_length_16001_cov_154_094327_g51_i0NODE_55_length_16001_cov_154_094327_g51_i0_p8_ORF_typecomplete_len320_score76_59SMN/PF06003_12/3_4e12SMN/PF06003_12/5_8e02TUDOR/PF00567_24/7_6e02TUDOR/PF00567_24/4_1e07Agenet/PF05641_12/0_00015PCB_OB/PF17092_5/1_2e02PCB_OB/PF17092_5/0_04PCB_OB/PF17092_5/7_4e03Fis1_TPR_C/PF14853_6/0_035PWWP/PF00855_17/8_1CHD5/PF04420_14/1_2_NODE_55_length_16001_cov_154_094327_g51_i037894748
MVVDVVDESLETLEAKLHEYQSSLDGIREALVVDPGNQELLKLQSDLEEVIAFFQDLAQAKRVEQGLPAEPPDDTAGPSRAEPQSPQAPAESRQISGVDKIIGRTCCLETPNGFIFGEILSIENSLSDGSGSVPSHVKVLWFATKQKQMVPAANLRLLAPMPPELVIPGMQAQALYAEDGEWYECAVESITGEGYVVTYTGYGNTETIPVDRLRPANTPIHSKKQEKKKVKEIITPAGFRIPSNLIAKPSDTEAQKADKRRRLNKLKREQKAAQEEQEARRVQSSWMTHVKKAGSKGTSRLKGALLHTKPATAAPAYER